VGGFGREGGANDVGVGGGAVGGQPRELVPPTQRKARSVGHDQRTPCLRELAGMWGHPARAGTLSSGWGRVARSGTFPHGRGRAARSGTGLLSPTASNAPGRSEAHLAARNVPLSIGGGPGSGGQAWRGGWGGAVLRTPGTCCQ